MFFSFISFLKLTINIKIIFNIIDKYMTTRVTDKSSGISNNIESLTETISLFIFRRDYRLDDNTSLIKACTDSNVVYPIFIITPEQTSDTNKYRSLNSIQFLTESLKDLQIQLNNRLAIYYGENSTIIKHLIQKHKINNIYFNKDYTPYAIKRDKEIMDMCTTNKVNVISEEDYTLTKLDSVKTGSDTGYTMFTPYMTKAKKQKVNVPVKFKKVWDNKIKLIEKENNIDKLERLYTENINLSVRGGRTNALSILKHAKHFDKYHLERNNLMYETTKLSAYIKFGCVSIREIYNEFKKKIPATSSFFNELYWHDFYAQAIYHYPTVMTKKFLDDRFGNIKWEGDKSHFIRWCQGLTGFPVVDAGMRQMNATGFMHNRARMIVASFLVKTLLCDWKWGEKYFATKLVDYDPCSNIGGWLWTSGGGFDSQPYFRIFNPKLQSEKFDENCEYIKKWIPELKDVPPKDIHNWDETCDTYLDDKTKNIKYVKPIVDYSKKRIEALEMYKKYM